MGAASTTRFDRKRLIWFGVSLALLGGIIWYLPRVADFPEVWAHVKAMTPAELAILGAVAAWNLVTYWIGMVTSTPGLKYRQAMVATEASTAVSNTIPGGSAISLGLTYKMLGSWGFSKSRITQGLLVSGIWNNFVKLGMPVLALALLAFSGRVTFTVASTHPSAAPRRNRRSGRRRTRPTRSPARQANCSLRRMRAKTATAMARAAIPKAPATIFRGRVIGMVRHSWIRLTVVSLVGHLSLFAVLVVALRDVGVSQNEVSWVEILAVFAFVRLLTAVPIMPGGVGIIEVGLISGLSAAGGDHAQVVAAVLVFRALTYVVPIVFGLGTYLYWRNNRSWLGSAPPAASFLNPAPAISGIAAR